jgi:hypothetical protein
MLHLQPKVVEVLRAETQPEASREATQRHGDTRAIGCCPFPNSDSTRDWRPLTICPDLL